MINSYRNLYSSAVHPFRGSRGAKVLVWVQEQERPWSGGRDDEIAPVMGVSGELERSPDPGCTGGSVQ